MSKKIELILLCCLVISFVFIGYFWELSLQTEIKLVDAKNYDRSPSYSDYFSYVGVIEVFSGCTDLQNEEYCKSSEKFVVDQNILEFCNYFFTFDRYDIMPKCTNVKPLIAPLSSNSGHVWTPVTSVFDDYPQWNCPENYEVVFAKNGTKYTCDLQSTTSVNHEEKPE